MDVRINLAAVFFLGVVCCLCVGGIVVCEVGDKPVPTSLSNIAYVCAGAIAGFLGTQRATAQKPKPPDSSADHS